MGARKDYQRAERDTRKRQPKAVSSFSMLPQALAKILDEEVRESKLQRLVRGMIQRRASRSYVVPSSSARKVKKKR